MSCMWIKINFSVFLLRNDYEEMIKIAISNKSREEQRQKFKELNQRYANLKYSSGILE